MEAIKAQIEQNKRIAEVKAKEDKALHLNNLKL